MFPLTALCFPRWGCLTLRCHFLLFLLFSSLFLLFPLFRSDVLTYCSVQKLYCISSCGRLFSKKLDAALPSLLALPALPSFPAIPALSSSLTALCKSCTCLHLFVLKTFRKQNMKKNKSNELSRHLLLKKKTINENVSQNKWTGMKSISTRFCEDYTYGYR